MCQNLSKLKFLKSRCWWRESLLRSVAYAPVCWLPACTICAANICVILATHSLQQAEQFLAKPEIALEQLLKIMLVSVSFSILGLVMSFWALSRWIFSLTAYAHSLMQSFQSFSQASIKHSLTYTASRKGYLYKLWLMATISLIIPILCLSVLISLKILIQPDLLGSLRLIPALPAPAISILELIIIGLTMILISYMLTLIAFSSNADLSAYETVVHALKEYQQHWSQFVLLGILVLLLNLFISYPFVLLATGSSWTLNLTQAICWQLWAGLTSIFLWPLSLAPFCQLIKENSS